MFVFLAGVFWLLKGVNKEVKKKAFSIIDEDGAVDLCWRLWWSIANHCKF